MPGFTQYITEKSQINFQHIPQYQTLTTETPTQPYATCIGLALEALRSYRVTAKNIASAVITVEDQTYTGRAICPRNSAVTVKVDGVKLSEGDDYIITGYSDNIATGSKAKITIKGYGDYVGTKTASFKIKKQAFDDNMWLFSLKAGN